MGRLIDADALKRAVNEKRVVGRFNTIKLIDDAPTAGTITYDDVKKAMDTAYGWGKIDGANRPHGKWIYREKKISWATFGFYVCSECNEKSNYKTCFCANCGADMRGNANENEQA